MVALSECRARQLLAGVSSYALQPFSEATLWLVFREALSGRVRCRVLAHLYGPAVCCKLDVTDLEITGRAHLYSALERSVLLPAIMDIRTHPISFASRPWKAVCATTTVGPFPISSIQLADFGGNVAS